MRSQLSKPAAAVFAAISLIAMTVAPALAQFDEEYDPGLPIFERTWNRTDMPVADDQVDRTWIWGPGRTEVMTEEYADAPGGERQVQYFDKSRMEDNTWRTTTPPWDVTNGLLVVEMIEGWYQIGDEEFDESPAPADIQIAGDPGQSNAPTYRDINEYDLRNVEADEVGETITRTWTGENEVGDEPSLDEYNVTAAERLTVPGIDHTVASPFWDFMNSEGLVYIDGEYVNDDLFLNPYYATGFPLTEAYWSQVPVLGEEQWVLWQCFERRCLTYTPTNPEGFQVEAGNVGQHYWIFRYGEPQPPPTDFDGEYYVELNQLNESGVYGAATLELDGNQLTVMLHATGLTPDEMHMQHIHGPEDGNATCPDLSLDENGNGFIELEEGVPAYGPVIIPLFENEGEEEYPAADAGGEIRYTHTFTLSDEQLAALGNPLDRTIVVHGMNVGESYDPALPAACGEIVEMPEDQNLQYHVNLGSLNESGVTGTVELTLNGPWLTVSLNTTGNEPNQLHPQHIHGLADANATCPDESLDTDNDGIVSVGEGAPAYGPVLLPLTPFQTASDEGEINYEQQILVNLSHLGDLTERTVVTHGMVNPNTNEYDASIPVSCGEVMEGELPPPPEEQQYMVLFGQLNNSGVSGTASLALTGDQLSVQLDVAGYVPDQMHMQHIHGPADGAAICPGPDADADDDGLVSISEGGPFYGPVQLPLVDDAEEYPMADGEGNLTFSHTYTYDTEALGDLTNRVIVLHGLAVGEEEEYDASVPVACGMIVPVDVETYVADELSGANIPEPVESTGTGDAWFWYDADGGVIYYMLSVQDLAAVTAAHIHGPAGVGEGAGVIVPLWTPEIPEEVTYDAYGILATGRITADELSGDLEGQTLDDLVALFGETDETSDAYVNVHTDAYPAGEIRDQVTALADMM